MQATTSSGSLLKATREAKGLSLEAVHEATKIPMDVLRAIEEGYTVRTLSPFYLKGFMKMYAEYLRVNVQDVIPEYAKKTQQPSVPILPQEEFDVAQWAATIFTRQRKQQIVALLGILFVLFALFKVITFFTHKRPPSDAPAVSQKRGAVAPKNTRTVQAALEKKSSIPASAKPMEPLPKIPPQTVYTASRPVVTPPRQVQKDIILTIRTKKDSWLRVESDGTVVFQSALSRGKSESWIANDKIEISGKNIDQLEFELNGKLLGPLSRRDRNAKKVVITREGLSVIP